MHEGDSSLIHYKGDASMPFLPSSSRRGHSLSLRDERNFLNAEHWLLFYWGIIHILINRSNDE